jgi:hypothetical protein
MELRAQVAMAPAVGGGDSMDRYCGVYREQDTRMPKDVFSAQQAQDL